MNTWMFPQQGNGRVSDIGIGVDGVQKFHVAAHICEIPYGSANFRKRSAEIFPSVGSHQDQSLARRNLWSVLVATFGRLDQGINDRVAGDRNSSLIDTLGQQVGSC